MSNILDRGMTEAQARHHLSRQDRKSWYPGTRALGSHGIIANRDGREVARCASRKDRDSIVAMARAHDAMQTALITLLGLCRRHPEYADHVEDAEGALDLSFGVHDHV